ncbi:MAG: EamA/RhaT family transporter [Comamonas sp.]
MLSFSETSLWIPVVVLAAAAQTVRNTAQRSLSGGLGAWPATLVRFLYGLPFTLAVLALLYLLPAQAPALPPFGPAYFGWIVFGAFFQVAATAALLMAMQAGNFAVSVTFSKTEVLQLVLFGALFLGELPAPLQLAGAALATAGVVLLAWHGKGAAPQGGRLGRASFYGLVCGACFALATLGFRGAALQLPGISPWLSAAWGVVLAQGLQTLALGGWLAWRDRAGLRACLRNWRVSLLAGAMGALASLLWFTAYALQTVAAVRTLGMVEVLFGYLVSRRLLRERLRPAEQWGIALVVLAVLLTGLGDWRA